MEKLYCNKQGINCCNNAFIYVVGGYGTRMLYATAHSWWQLAVAPSVVGWTRRLPGSGYRAIMTAGLLRFGVLAIRGR